MQNINVFRLNAARQKVRNGKYTVFLTQPFALSNTENAAVKSGPDIVWPPFVFHVMTGYLDRSSAGHYPGFISSANF